MKSRFLVLFICLLATVAMVGCDIFGSDDDDDVITAGTGYIRATVKSSDNAIGAITNATITSADGKQATYVGGVYQIDNVTINNGKVFLTIAATGHLGLETYEAVAASVSSEGTPVVEYILQKIPVGNIFNATDFSADVMIKMDPSADASVPGSATIEFEADSVVDTSNDNATVTNANVTAIYFEPKSTETLNSFPGSFVGVRTDGSTTDFVTYGFINVNLGDPNYKLTKPATITMKIADKDTLTAPATMPFWHYENGVWTEIGEAKKVGNNYVIAVNHFSWYNLDAPITTDRLDVIVASYTSELSEMEVRHGETADPSKTDLTKRVSGARVLVKATLETANTGDPAWGTLSDESLSVWQEAKVTGSNGVASFNIPTGKKFSIKITSGDVSKDAYMYEVKDGVATAFINLGSYEGEENWQDTPGGSNR